jgi:hypothetical protein
MIRMIRFRRGITMFTCLLMAGVLFTACNKNDDDLTPTPVAALMAFNLAPDQASVDIALSGNLIPGAPLGYSNYTGQYFNVFPGNRVVESYSTNANQKLDSLSYPFEQDKYYSLFVVGANNNYRNIVTVDNYDSLTASSGKAYVRYINAIVDSSASAISIKAGGSNVVNNTNVSFGQVSEFIPVTPGQVSINITNESSVNANRTISLEQHKAYTVLFMGMPNQADSTKAVQIRFIENGAVTD